MYIAEWLNTLKEAYFLSGKYFTNEMECVVLLECSEEDIRKLENFIDDACDSMMRLFFRKAATGNTYGSLDKVKQRFGKTLEERYGLETGVFINFARTYWTYSLEIIDLIAEQKNRTCMYNIVNTVDIVIASRFFPTPGPAQVPNDERIFHQKELLKAYGQEINCEELVTTNPLFQKPKGILSRIFGK